MWYFAIDHYALYWGLCVNCGAVSGGAVPVDQTRHVDRTWFGEREDMASILMHTDWTPNRLEQRIGEGEALLLELPGDSG